MRGSVRILLASVVVLLAMASTTHLAVTDSWYSDTERVDVAIDVPQVPSVESSFSFDNAQESVINGTPLYTVSSGPHVLLIKGEVIGFQIMSGSLKIGEVKYKGPDEPPFVVGTNYFEVVSDQVVLKPL